jgi:hypothetical protein
MAIDVTGEQETTPIGGPLRSPTRATRGRPLQPYLATVVTRSLFTMFPPSSSSSYRFLRFVAAVPLQVGAALDPAVVSSLPPSPSLRLDLVPAPVLVVVALQT